MLVWMDMDGWNERFFCAEIDLIPTKLVGYCCIRIFSVM